MVKLNKIYTRTGDDGQTGLVGGARVSKADVRVAAYGDVDETNSALGLAICVLPDGALKTTLLRVQNDLFDLGADLANPASDDKGDRPVLRINAEQADWLESQIDHYNADLSALRSFVLPGGSEAAARLHLVRAICRRAERSAVALLQVEGINAPALIYLNRLSDFLFVAARWVNNKGTADVLWVPGGGQSSD
ncbi:MAG: ATP:cob(I)alamin adenosyltransferase [Robiginitomaculum sp.]|nr:MAG: ATP:cob(I)alamin adenosyltransferase [Robiginitomaculum sp.]